MGNSAGDGRSLRLVSQRATMGDGEQRRRWTFAGLLEQESSKGYFHQTTHDSLSELQYSYRRLIIPP
jgi:hypothetical protein